MKKQKTKFLISAFLALFVGGVFAGHVLANGGATVSWIAPTTDEGNITPMTGLTGYRVYYSTSVINCANWDAANQATRLADAGTLLPATYRTVSGGSTLKYTFSNTSYLTPGLSYNFAVVAYDGSGNLSKCATGSGSVTTVSKEVLYAGDINNDRVVNGGDSTTMANAYLSSNAAADINKDGVVNGGDSTIMAADYLKPAL